MGITKEEYLAALEIVNKYHEQILIEHIKAEQISKYKTRDFLNKYGKEMSKNLYNYLYDIVTEAETNDEFNLLKPYLYLENITEINCAKLRYFGKKRWTELKTLLDKYYTPPRL